MTSQVIDIQRNMRSKPILPYSFEERLQMPSVLRIPANYDAFIELLIMCQYKVEYSNGDIVSILETDHSNSTRIMGNASLTHEKLVANLSFLLGSLFFRNPFFSLYGSHVVVFHTEGLPTYNPDLVIVKGLEEKKDYKFKRKTQEVLLNPWLAVEVLSQGTRTYDLNEKCENYGKIDSLQHIVFVEQYWCEVLHYSRLSNGEWTSTRYEDLTSLWDLEKHPILLSDIYNKIEFTKSK